MNTTTPTLQPPEPREFSSGDCVIGVHIGAANKLLIEILPPDNFIAIILIRRLLANALQNAGLLDSKVVGTGRMDDLVILVGVTDGPAAVEIIKAELAATMLLGFAKIGIGSEGRWRCVHPSPTVRMDWLLDTERHELHDAQRIQAMFDRIQQMAEFIRRSMANPELSPEDRQSLAEALLTAEQFIASFPPPPNPEAQ